VVTLDAESYGCAERIFLSRYFPLSVVVGWNSLPRRWLLYPS